MARHSSLRLQDEVCDAALGAVGQGSTELLMGHILGRHGLDDVGAGDVHLADSLDHENEVGDGRRVDGASRRGPQNYRYLGYDARGQGVSEEDLPVRGQAEHALLDAGAARVVQADDGAAGLQGQVHHLADLLTNHLGDGAAEDGKVLGVDEHLSPVHQPVARHHSVAEDLPVAEAEIRGPVGYEWVDLSEGTRVQEEVDTLPAGQLPLGVLLLDSFLAATRESLVPHCAEPVQAPAGLPVHRHTALRLCAWLDSGSC